MCGRHYTVPCKSRVWPMEPVEGALHHTECCSCCTSPDATRSVAHHLKLPGEESTEDSSQHLPPSWQPVVDSAHPAESQAQLLEVLKETRSIAKRLVSANLQEQGWDNPAYSDSGDDMVTCQCE